MVTKFGVRTLDPEYPGYSQDYSNNGDNYHNGPQWVWLYGKFIVSKCIFNVEEIDKNLFFELERLLNQSPAKGLPEIINADGSRNENSCDTQAWSNACLLEAYFYCKSAFK